METKWRKEIEAETEKIAAKQKELDMANEKIVGLMGEIEQLKLALKDEKNAAHAENAQERLAALNSGEWDGTEDQAQTEEVTEADDTQESEVVGAPDILSDLLEDD